MRSRPHHLPGALNSRGVQLWGKYGPVLRDRPVFMSIPLQPFSRCQPPGSGVSLEEQRKPPRQERTMTQQTGRHHAPIGVFVERALLAVAIIGIIIVLIVGFL